jgi:tetratricopeptide (TPR) repeat protein
MALRVCPLKQSEDQTEAFYEPIMDACFLHPINGNQIQKQQAYGYIFRDLADNSHYYDEFSRNYLRNYRLSSIRYADYLIKVGQTKKAGIVLNAMNTHISPIHFPMNYLFYLQIADLYRKAGYTKEMSYFSLLGAQYADALIMNKNLAAQDPYAKDFSPYVAAAEGYQYSGRIDIAIERLRTFLPETNNDPYLQNKIDELELLVLENKKQYSEALILAETFLKRYMDPSNKRLLVLVPRMEQKVNELRVILGLTPLESMTRILN